MKIHCSLAKINANNFLQAIYGEESAHPDIATYSNLGRVYHDEGKHEEAVKMDEKSLEMRLAIYGEESAHPHIATSVDNLGRVYHDEGKHGEALKMYERSIDMRQGIDGGTMMSPPRKRWGSIENV